MSLWLDRMLHGTQRDIFEILRTKHPHLFLRNTLAFGRAHDFQYELILNLITCKHERKRHHGPNMIVSSLVGLLGEFRRTAHFETLTTLGREDTCTVIQHQWFKWNA